MFLPIILVTTFVTLAKSECIINERFNASSEIQLSYNCSNMILRIDASSTSNTTGVEMESIIIGPGPGRDQNYVVDIDVDKLSKLDLQGGTLFDSYHLTIYEVELEQERSYTEVLTKLGISPSIIKGLLVDYCPNFTLAQLNGFNYVLNLDISHPDLDTPPGQELGKMFPKLETLRLHSDKVKTAPSLAGLKYLQEVNFLLKNVEELPDNYFVDNGMLTHFEITESKFKKLPSNICEGLNSLEFLSIHIGEAPFPVFGKCPELHDIFIVV